MSGGSRTRKPHIDRSTAARKGRAQQARKAPPDPGPPGADPDRKLVAAATPASSSNGRPAQSHPHAGTSPPPNAPPTSLCRHLEATVTVSPWPALHGDHRSAASGRSGPAWPRSSPLRAPTAMKPSASKLPSPPPRPPPPPSAERRHNHHHHGVASTNHCRDGRPQPAPAQSPRRLLQPTPPTAPGTTPSPCRPSHPRYRTSPSAVMPWRPTGTPRPGSDELPRVHQSEPEDERAPPAPAPTGLCPAAPSGSGEEGGGRGGGGGTTI
nr:uncharacterized protein LOC127329176 [Lolium perenne]